MTYLLDTNTLIYYFKGMGRVKERLLSESHHSVVVPAIVLFELEFGLLKSHQAEGKKKDLHAFLKACRLCPFGEREAEASARVRFELEKRGQPIGPLDTLIAGTALAHGWTLVTHNLREFSKIHGLSVEDWH